MKDTPLNCKQNNISKNIYHIWSSNFDCDFELEIVVLQKSYFLQNERGLNVDSKNGPKIKNPMSDAKVMVDEVHPFKL